VNATYERFYGPESVADGCLACQYEQEQIGPLHGPDKPRSPSVSRWSMTPREWAGDGPLKFWGN
jgi:hypothetical protein